MKKIFWKIVRFIDHKVWYMKSDITIYVEKVSEDGKQIPFSFYFSSKAPFSKRYQYHSESKVEDLWKIYNLLLSSIERKKKGIELVIRSGLGTENVTIHKGSMKKAVQLIEDFYAEFPNEKPK